MSVYIGQIFSSVRQSLVYHLGFEKRAADSLFEKTLFAGGPVLPSSSPLCSGLSINNGDVVSDYTGLYRSSDDLVSAILNQFPESSLGFMGSFFSGMDAALVYQASGLIQLRYPFAAIARIKAAFDGFTYSRAIGDSRGVLMAGLRGVGGGTYLVSGVSLAALRPLSMIRIASHASVQSLTGRISSSLGLVGGIFFALYYAIATGILGLQVQERVSFIQGLDQAGDLSSKIAWLQSQLEVDPTEIQRKLIEKHGEEKAMEILIDEAMASGKERVKAVIKELGIPTVQEEKLEETVRSAMRKRCWGWSSAAIERHVNEKLMLVGLSMRVQKTQLKQGEKIKRILGRSGLAAMREVTSLRGRITTTDERASELIETVRFSAIKQNRQGCAIAAILTVGFVAIILSLVLTTGIPLIIAGGLSILSALLIFGLEAQSLYKSYKSEAPSAHDKKFVQLMVAIGVLSFVTLMLLGAFGVVALGPAAIIVAAVLTALWLGQSGATLWIMDRNEKRHLLKNPSLEDFIKALDDRNMSSKVEDMFANLPEEIRGQIQGVLSSHGNNKKRAALSVARRIEEMKAKKLEMLRTALEPHLVTEIAS